MPEKKIYTVEEAKKWLAKMGERGVYGGASARLRATAIERLVSVLDKDEPQDVDSVLTDLDSIAQRWATRDHAKPETVTTYKSRTRATLEDFLKYQQNPAGFKVKPQKKNGDAGHKPAASRKPAKPVDGKREVPPPPGTSQPERTYQLTKGDFAFRLPQGGMTVHDVLRLACHLVTMAEDFDPSDRSQASLFAMARSDKG